MKKLIEIISLFDLMHGLNADRNYENPVTLFINNIQVIITHSGKPTRQFH
jgi:hypothetical protein